MLDIKLSVQIFLSKNYSVWGGKYQSNVTKWSTIKPEHVYLMHKLITFYCKHLVGNLRKTEFNFLNLPF